MASHGRRLLIALQLADAGLLREPLLYVSLHFKEHRQTFDAARRAEHVAHADPRTACVHARRALKLAVGWVYKHDPALRLPYDDRVSAAHPTLRRLDHVQGGARRGAHRLYRNRPIERGERPAVRVRQSEQIHIGQLTVTRNECQIEPCAIRERH